VIRQLVAALNEAGVEIDAETIADALWLTRARREESGGGDRQAASAVREAPTEPRPPDAEPQDPADDTRAERAGDLETGKPAATSQAGYDSDAEASSITLRKARALPGTLELGRALRPLKQRHPSKRGRVLNADATVEYFCDTGVLTPVMLPGAERWFDVDVLVDVGPSMAVWQDTAAEFVSLLQRHGAFREVRQWNLEQADGKVRLSRAADLRSEAAGLVDPHARRLIMLVTDCIGPMWYQAPIWDAIRGWGLFSPTVMISPLPSRLWQGTALGSPGVTLRSHWPGAANRSLDVTLPWWWPDNEPPLSAVPVPVITLEAGQVTTWARMVMGAGGVESLGVFATPPPLPPSKALPTSGDGLPDAEERVLRFRVTVSPIAYRLAVYLSAVLRGRWGLELARVLQEALLPDSGQVNLAEVLVGGLVRQAERPEGQEELSFEFIDGVVNVLQRSLTGTEALRVLQALGAYVERETGRSPGIAAMLLGETAPSDGAEPFEDVRAGAANLIQAMGLAGVGVISGRATEAPSTSVVGEPAASLRKLERVVRVIGLVDGRWRQMGSGYRVAGRFVLTAAHNVRGSEHRVWLPDGEYVGRVVADGGPDIDLALLDIGGAYIGPRWYVEFAKVAPRLRRGEGGEGDYVVDEENRTIQLLESGAEKVEDWLGLDKLYDPENILLAVYLDRALRAKEFFKRDRNYVVRDGEVLMVDESTGQIVYGRRYGEGIHQAIEAKEGVAIEEGSQSPVAEVPPTQCARVDRNVPGRISGCVAVGFPQYAARSGAPSIASNVEGWIQVGSGMADGTEGHQAGLLTLKAEGVAPRPLPTTETELGRSVWAGMSGAAVFANGILVGVVAEKHLPDGDGSLSVVPIEWAGQLADADSARMLQALGVESAAEMDLLAVAAPTQRQASVPPVSVPLTARLVEVIADLGESADIRYRLGSGCIVRGRTVLTAAHVVAGAVSILVHGPDEIAHQATADPAFTGDVDGPGPDLALIEIIEGAVDVPAMGLAAVDRNSPVGDPVERCHVIGYPAFTEQAAARGGDRFRQTADAVGHVPVLSGLAGGLLSVQVSVSPQPLPPTRVALGDSPWAGMSGAPVIADGYLLAVVTERAPREGPSAITATPLTALEHDAAHPGWGPGVADPSAWWARLGVFGLGALIRLPAPLRRGRTPYWATVQEIRQRTGVLTGRQDELAEIASFAAGDEGYQLLVGEPWAGKTALLAEAVTTLPEDIDVVCYFLSRREADADSSRFLAAVVPQLAYLLDEDPPTAELQQFRALWQRAAERAGTEGRHLLLVVDGLDEDLRPPGLPSVAALLPAGAGGHSHVLVSSRTSSGLPSDIQAGHPLRRTRPVLIEPSEGARELTAVARQEIDDLLRRDDDGLTADVLGLLTAAAGPLAVQDLAAMTVVAPQSAALVLRIRMLLTTAAARSLLQMGPEDRPRYQFAHESLLAYAQADDDLNAPDFRRRIHQWAEEWRARGWPVPADAEGATPRYLLDEYPNTLANEPTRLAMLVGDVGWVAAALQTVGVDRVLAVLATAQSAGAAPANVSALLEIVRAQAPNLRPPEPVGQPGYVLRQLSLQAAELGEDRLAADAQALLQALPTPESG
jgi:SecA preprotein cross-linking domain/Trypsin-like peptidase domain